MFAKDILPELISFTERNGMPSVVYFGVRCVPSVKVETILFSLVHFHESGISNGISSVIFFVSEPAFS